jgi:hypothetical protein
LLRFRKNTLLLCIARRSFSEVGLSIYQTMPSLNLRQAENLERNGFEVFLFLHLVKDLFSIHEVRIRESECTEDL